MVFFQAALLAGYAYAHAAPAWLGVRRHAVLHLGLLLLPLLVLPLRLPNWYPNPDDFHPIIWLIGLLLISAGLPFTVVAASTPLLQRWFTHTAAPAARDPYFLYGASNLGSILGLLAYPFLLEPTLSLAHQSLLWTAGYGLLIALTAACAVCLWRAPAASRVASAPGVLLNATLGAGATRHTSRRVRWVMLAFTPSSLMLSVTAYLVLVLACLLRPAPAVENSDKRAVMPSTARLLDWLLPVGSGVVTALLVLSVQASGAAPGPLSIALMFAAPLVIRYLFLFRPVRFGLGVAALLLAGSLYSGLYGGTELRMRSFFFAAHRVTVDPTGRFRQLVHGDTVHGRQSQRPGEEREPLTYYYRGSPVGQLFRALHYNDPEKRDPRLKRVGVVGLGAGELCCYAAQDQHWTFYEIDPAVKYIACDSGLFTFYRDCPAEKSVVLGDARLSLQRSDQRFGVLVVDAFNSDAIPVHLLTREALKVYFDHLDDDGILAFNISNRYLDLKMVVANLARNRMEGPPLACYYQEDRDLSDLDK
jgi:hypothetical protein